MNRNYRAELMALSVGRLALCAWGHCPETPHRVCENPDFGAVRDVKTHIIGGIRSQTAACQRAALRVHGAGKNKAGRPVPAFTVRQSCHLSDSAPIGTAKRAEIIM
jgi:hypothetical protein